MEQTFIDKVYDSVQAISERDVLVPGVQAAFTEGQICLQIYGDVFEAKCQLNDTYNDGHELEEVEQIISRMFDIMAEVGHQMYLYGAKFGIPEGEDIRTPAERNLANEDR